MGEPIKRGGAWWDQRSDGVWLRYDESSGVWEERADGPPAPDVVTEAAAPAPPAPETLGPGAESIEDPLAPVGGDSPIPPPLPTPDSVKLFEPLEDKSRWVVRLLVVVALTSLGVIATEVAIFQAIGRVLSGETVTFAEGVRLDDRRVLAIMVQLTSFVITAVFFLLWFYTAYQNIPRLGASSPRYRQGWAIGSWFVPVLNLWRPKQLINDVYRASSPSAPRFQGELWKTENVPGLLAGWWVTWIAAGFVSFNEGDESTTIESLRVITGSRIAGQVLVIVSAILGIQVVRLLTQRQDERAHRHGFMTGIPVPQPPPDG